MTRSSSSIVCLLLGFLPNPAATMTSLPWLCSSVVHSFCSPPVALATPPIAACGCFLIMHTHSCHAACQYAINTSHLFSSHEGSRASGFLPQSFSAAPRGSRLSASLFLYIVEGNKSHGEAYRIHCAAFIQAGTMRSSEGRRSVNSLLRRAGHVVLYFPLGSAVNEPLVSPVGGGTKERKQ